MPGFWLLWRTKVTYQRSFEDALRCFAHTSSHASAKSNATEHVHMHIDLSPLLDQICRLGALLGVHVEGFGLACQLGKAQHAAVIPL